MNMESIEVNFRKVFCGAGLWCVEYYGAPHYKIVTGSKDGKLRIFEIETKKLLGDIIAHSEFINEVLRVEEYIVSCSHDKKICIYSIIPPYNKFKDIQMRHSVFGMARIPNEESLIVSGNGFVCIVKDFLSLERVLYFVGIDGESASKMTSGWNRVVHSRNDSDRFYINLDENPPIVRLYSYERNNKMSALTVVRDFVDPKYEGEKNDTSSYLQYPTLINIRGQEILICGYDRGYVFFNTENGSIMKDVELKYINRFYMIKKNEPGMNYNTGQCFVCLDNKYVLSGDSGGQINIFCIAACDETKIEGEVIRTFSAHENNNVVYQVIVLETRKNCLKIASVSDDRTLTFSDINGICLNVQDEDEDVRISFLRDSVEIYCFNDKDEEVMFFTIRFNTLRMKMEKIHRSFLML